MLKRQDPPSLDTLPEVYIEALNRLDQKMINEDADLEQYTENNKNIDAQLANISQNSLPYQKQFVFRAVQMDGVQCQNPVFDFKSQNDEHASVSFSSFIEGDVIIPISQGTNSIEINVINDQTNQLIHKIMISLEGFADKNRRFVQEIDPASSKGVAIDYEGQLIYNQVDYFRGMLVMNNLKIDKAKDNKFAFNQIKE